MLKKFHCTVFWVFISVVLNKKVQICLQCVTICSHGCLAIIALFSITPVSLDQCALDCGGGLTHLHPRSWYCVL